MLIVILFLTVEEPFSHSEYTILYPYQEYMSSSFITPSPKLILKKKKKVCGSHSNSCFSNSVKVPLGF